MHATLRNGSVPTKIFISHQQVILENQTWNQMVAKTKNVYPDSPICKVSNLHIHEK